MKFAQIEYHGTPGVTRRCLDAIVRLFHFGNRVEKARILSYDNTHGFLLSLDSGEYVAIKSGFTSGYGGEGPRGLAQALWLLERYDVQIEEYEVDKRVLQDLNNSCMLQADLEQIESFYPVRPSRWNDYIYEVFRPSRSEDERFQSLFPTIVPFGILDPRLVDLALEIEEKTDHSVFTAYKRLEDNVRERTGLKAEFGQKLFSQAFLADDSKLHWADIGTAEQKGRAHLFVGAYMAFRNRRAHRETDNNLREGIREFLLINELFLLEAESVLRPGEDKS